MSKRSVEAFEIVSHGINQSDYFQGCGTAFTEFDEAFTGIGSSEYEAAQDAMDMAASILTWPDKVRAEIESDFDGMSRVENIPEEADEAWYYLTIRVKCG